jgi:dTMP kinase
MLPETEALLFAAARAQHVGEVIRPALQRGAVVIADRFVDSSLAYQGGGRGLPLEAVRMIQELGTDGLEPDLKLLLDLEPEVALNRRRGDHAEANRLDREELDFYRRVREAFLALAAADPARWRIVDAARSPESVWKDVWAAVVDSGVDCLAVHGAQAGVA